MVITRSNQVILMHYSCYHEAGRECSIGMVRIDNVDTKWKVGEPGVLWDPADRKACCPIMYRNRTSGAILVYSAAAPVQTNGASQTYMHVR